MIGQTVWGAKDKTNWPKGSLPGGGQTGGGAQGGTAPAEELPQRAPQGGDGVVSGPVKAIV